MTSYCFKILVLTVLIVKIVVVTVYLFIYLFNYLFFIYEFFKLLISRKVAGQVT